MDTCLLLVKHMTSEEKLDAHSKDGAFFKDRTFAVVKARDILPSSVLPSRMHEPQLLESVKTVGIQQFPIVRPHPALPDKFELIDGRGRLEALDPEQKVCCDVREKAMNADVFRISEATSKRTQRNAYENAIFYDAYVETVKKDFGEKGAVSRVAKEGQISESELSQYLAIKRLFDKLSLLNPELEFPKLKCMGINKLYVFSRLIEHPKFLETAQEIEQKADWLTVEGITELVEKVHDAEIDAIMRTIDFSAAPSPSIARVQVRLNVVPERISKMMKELSLLLPQFESGILTQQKFTSPETAKVLEKVSVNLRRLLYCLRKLDKIQKLPANEC